MLAPAEGDKITWRLFLQNVQMLQIFKKRKEKKKKGTPSEGRCINLSGPPTPEINIYLALYHLQSALLCAHPFKPWWRCSKSMNPVLWATARWDVWVPCSQQNLLQTKKNTYMLLTHKTGVPSASEMQGVEQAKERNSYPWALRRTCQPCGRRN